MSRDALAGWIDEIASLSDLDSFGPLVKRLATGLGYRDGAYYRLSRYGSAVRPQFVFGAEFETWSELYRQQGLALSDPVIPMIFRQDLPFTATEAVQAHPTPSDVHDQRLEHWAQDGLFCPVAGPWAEVGAFCWPSDTALSPSTADRLVVACLSNALVACHGRLSPAGPGRKLSLRPLSRRELECCYWLSEDEKPAGIARILSLSVHTVRQYIDSAMLKLGARNRAEMLLRAWALGLVTAGARSNRDVANPSK